MGAETSRTRIVVLLAAGAVAIGAAVYVVSRPLEAPTGTTAPSSVRAPVELIAPVPATLHLPQGAAPARGWPVIVLLHGTGASGARFVDFAETVNEAGLAAVVPTAPTALEPGHFGWPDDPEAIDRYVTKLSDDAIGHAAVDRGRMYVGGYSSGAWVAIRLAARRPDRYRGVLAFAPVGPNRPLALPTAAAQVEVRMFVGRTDAVADATSSAVAAEWQRIGGTAHVVAYEGGHGLPPSWPEMLRANARAMLER